VIYGEYYHNLTFSINDVPIVDVTFHLNKTITIYVNNMKERKYYDYKFIDDVDILIENIRNILISNGIDEMLKQMGNITIKLYAERSANGEIMHNKIIINRGHADIDNDGYEYVLFQRYEIVGRIELTADTLAKIITAFAFAYYS